jgi:hypothetical protein
MYLKQISIYWRGLDRLAAPELFCQEQYSLTIYSGRQKNRPTQEIGCGSFDRDSDVIKGRIC